MNPKRTGANIAQTVCTLLTPIVTQLGYSIWDVEFGKEGSRLVLRVTIDAPQGITIDDCERVHRAIDAPLDEADPIADPYYLEVSSPGLERVLRTPAHFAMFVGQRICVRLYAPLTSQGSKTLCGTLLQYEADTLLLQTADTPCLSIPMEKIAAAHAYYDFESEQNSLKTETE